MFPSIKARIHRASQRKASNRLLSTAIGVLADAEELIQLDDVEFRRFASDTKAKGGATLIHSLSLAVVAAQRALGLSAYPVQVAGALALSQRAVAEMQTGEGKTLTLALAAAARALQGHTVSIATVNDYLAGRDAEKLHSFYSSLGLSVGHARSGMSRDEKRVAYAADVTYATAQELGFDYLRDHLVGSLQDIVQGPLDVLLVDEADSILIDEAGTPLILTGEASDEVALPARLASLGPHLTADEHYVVDRQTMRVDITDAGYDEIEVWLRAQGVLEAHQSLHDPENLLVAHAVSMAITAHAVYRPDIEYLVKDGQIVIVDENTGRALPGRRWADGLHQAVEAKEGLPVLAEAPTLASITYQGFLKLFDHLAGVTGTADSARDELASQYGLDVAVIPTHRPVQRVDEEDLVYRTARLRDEAVVAEVIAAHNHKQPVLLGTDSVEASEALAETLRTHGLKVKVLNARHHSQEANVIAEAGRPGAITIATQMAGRGTDIILGGNLQAALAGAPHENRHEAIAQRWGDDRKLVHEAGGLYVIGLSRSPSRRVDRQLRGRSGRQGDPGRSRFFLSLEDEFVRTFAGDHLDAVMERLEVGDEGLEGRALTRIVRQAQLKREQIDQEAREALMKYDHVVATQRQHIYLLREMYMKELERVDAAHQRDAIVDQTLLTAAEDIASRHVGYDEQGLQHVDLDGLISDIGKRWNLAVTRELFAHVQDTPDEVHALLTKLARQYYAHRKTFIDERVLSRFETVSVIEGVDKAWQAQQKRLEKLREGIHLRAYANEVPQLAFQREAGRMFEHVLTEAQAYAADVLLGAHIPNKAPF